MAPGLRAVEGRAVQHPQQGLVALTGEESGQPVGSDAARVRCPTQPSSSAARSLARRQYPSPALQLCRHLALGIGCGSTSMSLPGCDPLGTRHRGREVQPSWSLIEQKILFCFAHEEGYQLS